LGIATGPELEIDYNPRGSLSPQNARLAERNARDEIQGSLIRRAHEWFSIQFALHRKDRHKMYFHRDY
jgi:hypothetical protein